MLNKGVWIGMRMGSKTGFVLSFLYSLVWSLLAFIDVPVMGLFVLCVATIVGIIPATTIGLITGAIVGWILQNLIEKVTLNGAILVGVLVSFGIVAIISVLILASGDKLVYRVDWYWIGAPSILYLLASGFMTNELARRLKQPESVKTFALIEKLNSSLNTAMLVVGVIFIVGGVGFVLITLWHIATFYSLFAIVFGAFLLWLFKSEHYDD